VERPRQEAEVWLLIEAVNKIRMGQRQTRLPPMIMPRSRCHSSLKLARRIRHKPHSSTDTARWLNTEITSAYISTSVRCSLSYGTTFIARVHRPPDLATEIWLQSEAVNKNIRKQGLDCLLALRLTIACLDHCLIYTFTSGVISIQLS
jgi:hypothetical protein